MIKNTVVKHARKFGYITEVDITMAGVYNTAIFKIVGIALLDTISRIFNNMHLSQL
jgi:hypothetical protein